MSASLQLLLGAVCISWAPILVKFVDVSPGVSAFYRVALGGLTLIFLTRLNTTEHPPSEHKSVSFKSWLKWLVLAGFFFRTRPRDVASSYRYSGCWHQYFSSKHECRLFKSFWDYFSERKRFLCATLYL